MVIANPVGFLLGLSRTISFIKQEIDVNSVMNRVLYFPQAESATRKKFQTCKINDDFKHLQIAPLV